MPPIEETRYGQLIENLNDAVYTVSIPTLTFTSANITAEKLTGYKREELLGMPVSKVIAPEFLKLVQQMVKRKRKKSQSTIYEIEIIQKNGKRLPVEISSVAITDNGVPVEILGVARDISERKAVEQQRNIFISLISHEVKNPLTSALVYVGALQRQLMQDSKSLSFLDSIYRQLTSINQLMSDLMDLTQMRMGKFQITKEEFDLSEAIREVTTSFRSSRIVPPNTYVSHKVFADKNRICQVLANLFSNALKYAPDDTNVFVQVSASDGKITVQVHDSGPGISKADQQHIFDLYFRAASAGNSTIKGHGLGLYICREIIRRHKGKIWVETALNQGSTFSFSMPVR